jgi:hypothetical protein
MKESKIQATETKFLRVITGKAKRDRIRNAHIRGQLRMEDIQNQIKANRLQWFGHVKRMDEPRIPKRILEKKMSGNRNLPNVSSPDYGRI